MTGVWSGPGSRVRAVGLLSTATLFWGGHYALSFLALRSISPIGLTWWRWLISVIPLVVIAQIVERPQWREVPYHLPRLALLAGLGMIGYNLLLYYALHYTTGVGAAVVNAANPALMALLAAVLVKSVIRPRQWVGIAVSLVGVLVVVSGGSPAALVHLQFNTGQLLVLGAILVWSLYTIYGRVPGVGPITAIAVEAGIAVVVLTPFALAGRAWLPVHDPVALGVVFYVALFPSIGSYVCWNLGMRLVPPETAGIFLNLVTVFAAVIGAFLGQPPTLWDLLGGGIIIAGVVLTALAPRPRAE